MRGERAVRLYLDSNVLISLVNREFGKAFEFMDQAVEEFLRVCGREGHTLVLSNAFFREVRDVTSLPEAEAMAYFSGVGRVEFVEARQSDFDSARGLTRSRGIHFADSVHAAIAVRCKCGYVVTWNLKDYDCVRDLVQSASPRAFI